VDIDMVYKLSSIKSKCVIKDMATIQQLYLEMVRKGKTSLTKNGITVKRHKIDASCLIKDW